MDDAEARNAAVAQLSSKDKVELQQFLEHEMGRARVQETTHHLTDICWTKCVKNPIRSGALDKSEESCMRNCVGRFLDGQVAVMTHLQNKTRG